MGAAAPTRFICAHKPQSAIGTTFFARFAYVLSVLANQLVLSNSFYRFAGHWCRRDPGQRGNILLIVILERGWNASDETNYALRRLAQKGPGFWLLLT